MKMPYCDAPSAAVKATSGTCRWLAAVTPDGSVPTGEQVVIALW